MFGHVADMWQRLTDVFLAAARSAKATAADLAAVQAVLEQARLSLKLLRLFVAHGSPDYHKLPAVVQFFPILVARHRAMLEVRYAVPEEHKLSEEVDKYITWCNKIYVDAQSKEPLSFVHVMESIMTLAFEQILDGKKGGKKRPPLERSLVLFMVLVVKLLQCPRYKPGCAVRLEDSHAAVAAALAKGDASETPTPAVMTAVGLVTRMFSQAMLTQICQVMVGEYFMMSAEEAEEWADSPEEYVFEEAGDAWMFSLRPCTVCLYVELIKQYKTWLTPVVVAMMKAVLASPPQNERAVLARDAVYLSLSGASGSTSIAHDLYEVVDFDALFQGTLIAELRNQAPQYKVVKRRVIWLIGQWVSVSFDRNGDKGLRRGLYEAIVHLMNPSQDMVVRITSSVTLKSAINDFGFKTSLKAFLPFLNQMVTSLFQLLHDVKQCQTKMQVLDVITLLFGEQ
eukprot:gene23311-26811_t